MGLESRQYMRRTESGGPGWSMTVWIIVVSVVALFVDGFTARQMGRVGPGFQPGRVADWLGFANELVAQQGQLWRLVSHVVIHADPWTLLINMMVLYWFGSQVEAFLGSRRFLAFYLLTGAAGTAVCAAAWRLGAPGLAPGWVLGAGAAIYGVVAGAAVKFPEDRLHLGWLPVSVSYRTIVLMMLAYAGVKLVGAGSPTDLARLGAAAAGYGLVKHPTLLGWAGRSRSGQAAGHRGQLHGGWARMVKLSVQEEAEVNRILDKVQAMGLHSLTDAEAQLLRSATAKLETGEELRGS